MTNQKWPEGLLIPSPSALVFCSTLILFLSFTLSTRYSTFFSCNKHIYTQNRISCESTSRSPRVIEMPARRSFFKSLAADIKASRDSIRAGNSSIGCSALQCNTHNRSLEAHRPSENATMSMHDMVLDDSEYSRPATRGDNESILVPDNKNLAQIAVGKNSLRAHFVDHECRKSLDVNVSVDFRSNEERWLVIFSGPEVLASFLINAINITRFWGVRSSTHRLVAITFRTSDPDGGNAVYLKLDSRECLERLSHITGFDLK